LDFTKLATSNAVANTVTRAALLAIIAPPLAIFLFEAVAGLSMPGAAGAAGAGAPFSLALLGRSVSMAALAALAATVVGTMVGLVAGRLGFWGSRIVLFALVMPIAAPPAIHAYVWRNIALSAGLLGDLFVEGGSWAVNFAGAVGSLVSAFWAIPALAAFAVAAGPGKRYELEARPFAAAGTAARRILVPSLLPGAAASGGIVFVLAFSDYIVASLWQIETYPVRILSIYSSFFEPRVAAAASLVPAAVTLVVCAGLFIAAGKALTRFDVERAVVERDILWRPGRALRALALLAVAALAGTPVIASAYWTWANWPGVGGLTTIAEDFAFTLAVAAVAAAAGACVAAFVAGTHWIRGRRWGYAMAALAVMVFLLPAAGWALRSSRLRSGRSCHLLSGGHRRRSSTRWPGAFWRCRSY